MRRIRTAFDEEFPDSPDFWNRRKGRIPRIGHGLCAAHWTVGDAPTASGCSAGDGIDGCRRPRCIRRTSAARLDCRALLSRRLSRCMVYETVKRLGRRNWRPDCMTSTGLVLWPARLASWAQSQYAWPRPFRSRRRTNSADSACRSANATSDHDLDGVRDDLRPTLGVETAAVFGSRGRELDRTAPRR